MELLDCSWWIPVYMMRRERGGRVHMEEGLGFVVVGLIPSSLIDDD